METAKTQVQQILEMLPEDVSWRTSSTTSTSGNESSRVSMMWRLGAWSAMLKSSNGWRNG